MDNPETLETLGRQKNVQTNYDRYQKQTQKHFGKQYTNVLTEKKEDQLKTLQYREINNGDECFKYSFKILSVPGALLFLSFLIASVISNSVIRAITLISCVGKLFTRLF
jgi:hypothetical protein